MSTSGISRLQHAQYASNIGKEANAKDDVDASLKKNLEYAEKAHKQTHAQIQKDKEAREKEQGWTLLGAIFLGPLIGSAIGGAIGKSVNDDEQEAAQQLKKQSAMSDHEAEKAMDEFGSARAALEDSKKGVRDAEKFGEELREQGWTGIV